LPFEGQLFAARHQNCIESQEEFQYQNWFFRVVVLLVDSSEIPDGDAAWVGRVGLTGSRHGLLSRGKTSEIRARTLRDAMAASQ
jgi:hypothetical protein